jgi:hypothetical protein
LEKHKSTEKMIRFGGIVIVCISFLLIRAGIKFEDKEAAGYLTKIRLIGGGILLLIGGVAILIKPNIH